MPPAGFGHLEAVHLALSPRTRGCGPNPECRTWRGALAPRQRDHANRRPQRTMRLTTLLQPARYALARRTSIGRKRTGRPSWSRSRGPWRRGPVLRVGLRLPETAQPRTPSRPKCGLVVGRGCRMGLRSPRDRGDSVEQHRSIRRPGARSTSCGCPTSLGRTGCSAMSSRLLARSRIRDRRTAAPRRRSSASWARPDFLLTTGPWRAWSVSCRESVSAQRGSRLA